MRSESWAWYVERMLYNVDVLRNVAAIVIASSKVIFFIHHLTDIIGSKIFCQDDLFCRWSVIAVHTLICILSLDRW